MSDASKCLSSKSVSSYAFEIFKVLQFACSESLTDNSQIRVLKIKWSRSDIVVQKLHHNTNPNTMTIILYWKHFQSPILDSNYNIGRSCIQRVFQQLFNCITRTINYFSSSDSIYNCRIKAMDTEREKWCKINSNVRDTFHLGNWRKCNLWITLAVRASFFLIPLYDNSQIAG